MSSSFRVCIVLVCIAATVGSSNAQTTTTTTAGATSTAPPTTTSTADGGTTAGPTTTTALNVTTTAASVTTTDSGNATVTTTSITTTATPCRDLLALCSVPFFRSLCRLPRRCNRSNSGSQSSESHSNSMESDEEADFNAACIVARHMGIDAQEKECEITYGSDIASHPHGKHNRGGRHGRRGGHRGPWRPRRRGLRCFFRRAVSEFYQTVCPETCGMCDQ